MPAGSGTNSNMNGIRIESRVLAPPGGFSSISFGGEASNTDKFKHHDFNPKTQKKLSEKLRDEENNCPVQQNAGNGNVISDKSASKQSSKQELPTSTLPPGRRGRGAGESSFSLGWE